MPKKGRKGPQLPLLPLFVFAVAVAAVLLLSNQSSPVFHHEEKTGAVVTAGDYSYNVLLALNESQWTQGLMNYTFQCTAPGGCVNGMLFVFPSNGTQCFWMKDTPEPLLQAWISGNTVTNVYFARPENTSTVCAYGDQVLELYSRLPLNFSVGGRVSVN